VEPGVTTHPSLSIIIPCFGHSVELEACLQAFETQRTDIDFEVIVVDSAFDPRVQSTAGQFSWARLVRSERHLFPGAARNLGVLHAQADLIGFVDADCIVQPGWVTSALQTIREGAILCSGPILDVLPWHLLAASDNRLQYADFPRGRPHGSAVYFSGAHLVVKKDAFELAGRFIEYDRHAQDVIFTELVVGQWPGRVIFNPMMKVSHYGRRHWKEFLEHHWHFGYVRAEYRIQISRTMMWIAKRPYLGWLLFLRRFLYISLRVIQWNLVDLPRFILQLPFIFIGLTAWVSGFYDGMRQQETRAGKR
jgi:glycosyltransferase involved in cell wall biosynthesis